MITATVTFKGTNMYGFYSTNVSCSNTFPATVVNVTFSCPQRIGITKNNHDRTKHCSASVTPSAEAANITLSASSSLSLSNVQNPGTGTINFDLVGTSSTALGGALVIATHSAGFSFTNTLSVIIPAAVGVPHPQFNGNVAGVNFVATSSSSPPVVGIPAPNNAQLVTLYQTTQSIPVVDQFGTPCGDIYDGSTITEQGGIAINQTLSGSAYNDPVGPLMPGEATTSNSQDALAWPTQPVIPMSQGVDTRGSVSVEVDTFSLSPAVTNREIKFTLPNTLQIVWP